jgi:RNA polymerase-binding transcription factor DksA
MCSTTEAAMHTTIVPADVRMRIESDLAVTLSRLRSPRGAVALEELAGTDGQTSAFADEVDQMQATASRDIGLATRDLLLERASRLSAALSRLDGGTYGVCDTCAEPIASTRLDAAPEVQTCVRCQAGLERLQRPDDRSRRRVFVADDGGPASEAITAAYRSSLFPNEEDRAATR